MHSHPFTMAAAASCVLAACTTAAADLPPDRYVAYLLRTDPNNPNSPLAFAVAFGLTAASASGDSVGWGINHIEFVEFNMGGAVSRTWLDDQPNLATPDGLWWVEHAAPGSPQASEFALPPAVSGMAATQDPGTADLDYAFSGTAYDPTPGDPPYAATAALYYFFILLGELEPIRAGENEPVEIDDERDPLPSQQVAAHGFPNRPGGLYRPSTALPCGGAHSGVVAWSSRSRAVPRLSMSSSLAAMAWSQSRYLPDSRKI